MMRRLFDALVAGLPIVLIILIVLLLVGYDVWMTSDGKIAEILLRLIP